MQAAQIHDLPTEILLDIFSTTYLTTCSKQLSFEGFSPRQVQLLRLVCRYWSNLLKEENFRYLQVDQKSFSRVWKFLNSEQGLELSKLFKFVRLTVEDSVPKEILSRLSGAVNLRLDHCHVDSLEPLQSKLDSLSLKIRGSFNLQRVFSHSIGSLRKLDLGIFPLCNPIEDLLSISQLVGSFRESLQELGVQFEISKSHDRNDDPIIQPRFPPLRKLKSLSFQYTSPNGLNDLSLLALFPDLGESQRLNYLKLESRRIFHRDYIHCQLPSLQICHFKWNFPNTQDDVDDLEAIGALMNWIGCSESLEQVKLDVASSHKWELAPADIFQPFKKRKVHLIIRDPPCNHCDIFGQTPQLSRVPHFEKVISGLKCLSLETWDPRILPPKEIELLSILTIGFEPVWEQLGLMSEMIIRGDYPRLRGLKINNFNHKLRGACKAKGISFLFGNSEKIMDEWDRIFKAVQIVE